MRVRAPVPVAKLVVFGCMLAAAPASGQSARGDDASVTVVVLPAPAELSAQASNFYDVMRTQVEFHPAYDLNDVPEQSLDDLLLAMGCSVLDAECAAALGDVLEGDLLVSGAFYAESGSTSVRVDLVDLRTGAVVRSRSHAFADPGESLVEFAALIARSVLYGDEGVIHLAITPAEATVTVAGTEYTGPEVVVAGLPIGLMEVSLVAEGYVPRTEVVAADRGDTVVTIAMQEGAAMRGRRSQPPADEPVVVAEGSGEAGPLEASPPPAPRRRTALWTGVALSAAGAGALAAGTALGVAEQSTQDEFDALIARPTFSRAEANALVDRGQSQAAGSTASFIAGGALVAGGLAAIVVDLTRRPATEPQPDPAAPVESPADPDSDGSSPFSEPTAEWSVFPTRGGAAATLRIRF